MIYDVRIYDIQPGKVQEYMKNVREIAIPVRQDYGVKLAGWYYSEIGPLNQVVHIWAYQDLKHLAEGRPAVRTDPRWTNEYQPRNLGLVKAQRDHIAFAPDFAPQWYEFGPPQNSNMVYDMRIYDIKPGKLQQYMDAVREVGLPVRQSHGVKLAGWFYSEIGTLNHVVHIWAYQGFADMAQKLKVVNSDPFWTREYLPRVQPTLAAQRDQLMFGASFFPGPA